MPAHPQLTIWDYSQQTAGPRSIRVRGKTTMMFVSQVQSLISCKRGRNGVQFENHLDQLLLPRTFLDLHSHLVEWSMACHYARDKEFHIIV